MIEENIYNRRSFIEKSLKITIAAGIAGSGLISGCTGNKKENENSNEKPVSPPEDLMQEHGVLNRILLIYDKCRADLVIKKGFQPEQLLRSAEIMRSFVEDYHEKQEEKYLFPRFEQANLLKDLVQILQIQHDKGRSLTNQITILSRLKVMNDKESNRLFQLLSDFNIMYRPHEAREDTILFPAFRKLVSKNEYDALGEEFEKNEQKQFGQDGFEKIISQVEEIEKQLGIYDLSNFTPK